MTPDTSATRAAIAAGIRHRVVEFGAVASLEEAARRRGVPVHKVLKSLVVRVGADRYVMVLVPGDRVIDWPKLRTEVGKSRMTLAPAEEALEVTGYPRGAITPFGSKRPLPVICDESVSGEVSVGGGTRGVAIYLEAADLVAATSARVANVTRSAD